MNPILEAWRNPSASAIYVTKVGWDIPRRIDRLHTVVADGDILDKSKTYALFKGSTIRYTLDVLELVTEPKAVNRALETVPLPPSFAQAILTAFWGDAEPGGRISKEQSPDLAPVWVLGDDWDEPRLISAITPSVCPSCGKEEDFGIASHGCSCGRLVCGNCKVDDDGESAPCSGTCKICRGGEPAKLRADQYLARIGSTNYWPLGMLRLITADDEMLALYTSLTGDPTGDDPERDSEIRKVIDACIDAESEDTAIVVLREAGWDSADPDPSDAALLRYVRAFRGDTIGGYDADAVIQAGLELRGDLIPTTLKAVEVEEIRQAADPPPPLPERLRPETWKRLAEEAGSEDDAPQRRVVWYPSTETWEAIIWKADELKVKPHDLAKKLADDAGAEVTTEHRIALQRKDLTEVPMQILLAEVAERQPALNLDIDTLNGIGVTTDGCVRLDEPEISNLFESWEQTTGTIYATLNEMKLYHTFLCWHNSTDPDKFCKTYDGRPVEIVHMPKDAGWTTETWASAAKGVRKLHDDFRSKPATDTTPPWWAFWRKSCAERGKSIT